MSWVRSIRDARAMLPHYSSLSMSTTSSQRRKQRYPQPVFKQVNRLLTGRKRQCLDTCCETVISRSRYRNDQQRMLLSDQSYPYCARRGRNWRLVHAAYMLLAVSHTAVWDASKAYGRELILSTEAFLTPAKPARKTVARKTASKAATTTPPGP